MFKIYAKDKTKVIISQQLKQGDTYSSWNMNQQHIIIILKKAQIKHCYLIKNVSAEGYRDTSKEIKRKHMKLRQIAIKQSPKSEGILCHFPVKHTRGNVRILKLPKRHFTFYLSINILKDHVSKPCINRLVAKFVNTNTILSIPCQPSFQLPLTNCSASLDTVLLGT